MCGMYTINGVHGPEPRSSGGNTSNPHVSSLIPRPVFNGMERMCQRHGSNQNSYPSVLVRKLLCNQLIHYHISSRGVFGSNDFELRNFAVVAIECSFTTISRGSIMARIYSTPIPGWLLKCMNLITAPGSVATKQVQSCDWQPNSRILGIPRGFPGGTPKI